MKHVVITGGTRGLGYELARAFGAMGWMVSISGRSAKSASDAVASLNAEFPGLFDAWGRDVSTPEGAEELWKDAEARAPVDVWINNAGINQERGNYADIATAGADDVIRTNLSGAMYGTKAAFKGMKARGAGRIYLMEGFGSDGMKLPGMTVYGTSKAALRYFAESFALEARGSGVAVGTLSPGMMVTDFLMDPLKAMPKDDKDRLVRMYDILADKPRDVAAFLAGRIAADRSAVPRIRWLTPEKVALRFLSSAIRKRKVVPAEYR